MLELKLDEVTKKYKDNIAVNHLSTTFTTEYMAFWEQTAREKPR